jgi:hypothetical protein
MGENWIAGRHAAGIGTRARMAEIDWESPQCVCC